jgi:hypothetical protein
MSGDTTTNYPLCFACRYYDRLSALLYLALFQPTMMCALLYLPILQPTIRSALSALAPTDYPLWCLCRYSNRLSALPTIHSGVSAVTPTDYPLYRLSILLSMALLWRYSNRLSALLSLPLIQSTIRSTDYPLCSFCRYSNQLFALPTFLAAASPLRFGFRLNDDFVARFLRLNAFYCIHCSLSGCLSVYLSLVLALFLPVAVSVSLPTE